MPILALINPNRQQKRPFPLLGNGLLKLRGQDSNLRPQGYEPSCLRNSIIPYGIRIFTFPTPSVLDEPCGYISLQQDVEIRIRFLMPLVKAELTILNRREANSR